MNRPEAIAHFERVLRETLAAYPDAAEPLAFVLRRQASDVVGVLMNLNLADKQLNPFPALDTITAAQCTVFDNWPKGTKPKTINGKREKGARSERFKATIEVWTITPEPKAKLTTGNAAFVGTANLFDGNNLAAKVQRMVKSDGSHEMTMFAKDMMKPMTTDSDLRCGPLVSRGNGTHHHMGTFATANAKKLTNRSSDLTVTVTSPSGDFAFSDWSTSYSTGEPLKGNAVLTCRWSKLDHKDWWTTRAKA